MMLKFFLNDWISNYLEKAKIDQTPADEILFYAALIIYCAFLCTMSALMYWCGKAIRKYYKDKRENKK